MTSKFVKLALTAALGLALAFTFTACEEKEAEKAARVAEALAKAAAAEAVQEASQEAAAEAKADCGKKESPPITTEAVFLEVLEGNEGILEARFRLANGEEIWVNADPEGVKKGDKVSITYEAREIFTAENDGGCTTINSLVSLKKMMQLVSPEEFNGKKIPMTVFYTNYTKRSDDDYSNYQYWIDSLSFTYDGKKQSVATDVGTDADRYSGGGKINDGMILVDDYNSDGYMDIAIFDSRGNKNESFHYFIYNPSKQNYHPIGTLANAMFDAKEKTVSVSIGSSAVSSTFHKYKWNGVELVLIHSETQDADETYENLITVTRTLQNGQWVENTKTEKIEN